MVKEADKFCQIIDKHLSTIHEISDRKKNVFHPSFMHNDCPRAIVYNYLGTGDFVVTDPRVKRIFANGHNVHSRIQKLLKDWGLLLEEEVTAENKEWRIYGHCDGILKLKRKTSDNNIKEIKVALEIKSINLKGFEYALKKGPKIEHICQVRIYMWLLGLKQGILYYECKNDQRHKAWIVGQNEKTINEVKNKIKAAIEYVDKKELPDASYNDNLLECRWCQYQEICKEEGGKKFQKRLFKIR